MGMGDNQNENENGIGIIHFLRGKNLFITGATGVIGKVEKILRTTPNVGRIFLLIKAKDMDHATQRFKTEIIDTDLFKCIKEIYGNNYEAFMMEKIVPVVGNVCEDDLGMDFNQANSIAKQIHVILHSAANTTFDERYDVSINTNTKGPARLLEFAKKCDNLRLFLHISTAYVNAEREGIIKEETLNMGQCVALDRNSSALVNSLDINAEIKLAFDLKESLGHNVQGSDHILKHFGLERARMNGWRNVYDFTKAMGEMLINSRRGNIPVVVIRPSIVESTYAEPFPGWIQGYRVMDPIFISYGKHQLSGLLVDPDLVVDIVPLDMVVNGTIAAMAKHGSTKKSEINIYHITSSISNPILFVEAFDFAYDYFTNFWLLDSKGRKINIKRIEFFKTIHTFVSHLKEQTAKSGVSEIQSNKTTMKNLQFLKLFEPLLSNKGRFDDEKTRKLITDMSVEEKKIFPFDVKSINWEYYIKNIHLPGIRKHVIKEPHNTSRL